MRKGFTLIEVVVGTSLLLLLGAALTALLARSETTARSSEAAEAAALFARTMILQAQNSPPDWLPQTEGTPVALTRSQIASILNQVPYTTYASPDLYEVRVTRNPPTPQGFSNFTAEVCVRSVTRPVCVSTDLFLAASSVHVPPPQGAPVPPPSGRAVVFLSITGPDGGTANVSLAGQTYTRFGLYTQEVSPGTVTLTAEDTDDGRYTYTASPRRESATVSAGTSRSFYVTYTCATGAATFSVIPPPGVQSLSQGTVTLEPGGTDISRGGLVPYLAPQRYTVNARDIRSGSYTYSPRVSPDSNFAVAPCQTQNVTVAYAPVTGALRINISKPQGMSASAQVRVTGPDRSLPVTVRESITLENLAPGRYSISPQDILDNGVRFRGTASPQNPTVRAGETATVQVDYAPASTNPPPGTGGGWGAIIITVSGLPRNASAVVSVSARFVSGSHAGYSFFATNGTYTVAALGGRVFERGWYYVSGMPYEDFTSWGCRPVYEATVSPAQFLLEPYDTKHVTVTYRLTRRAGTCPP
jgi:prepilin-type N-terminal cleavage/methylation domain-containing protein